MTDFFKHTLSQSETLWVPLCFTKYFLGELKKVWPQTFKQLEKKNGIQESMSMSKWNNAGQSP